MRLKTLRIENFRAFSDQVVHFSPYTALVGANGAGKSTVLVALNVLFRHTASAPTNVTSLSEEDFHRKDTTKPVVITATFGDLPAQAKVDFKAYVRQDKLILRCEAKWDANAGAAEVHQYGSRLVNPRFKSYFEADGRGEKVDELRSIYRSIASTCPDLPAATTNPAMAQALRTFEEAHPDQCELLDSEDQFYGFSRGANLLSKYLQWVFVPAVKDAASEQEEARDTALGELLQRTIRTRVNFDEPLAQLRQRAATEYESILHANKTALGGLEQALQGRLRNWSHPGAVVELDWSQDPEKSVAIRKLST